MKHLKTFKDISGIDCVQVLAPGGWPVAYRIGSDTDEEVAAYYRKREDERLGRESFEVDGELFYVYDLRGGGRFVTAVAAKDGYCIHSYGTEPMKNPQMPIYKAYNMWFEAHNPPKEPQEGELWDIEEESGNYWRCVVRGDHFVLVNYVHSMPYALDDPRIKSKEFVL